MSWYLVFACPRCGAFRYSKEGQKTATCFSCNHQISLNSQKIRILRKTRSRQDAIETVQNYKMKTGSHGRL